MKRVLNSFKRLGARVESWEAEQSGKAVVDPESKPLVPFTIRKQQFYRLEMLPWVPMEERFKVRNFEKLAMSERNLGYLD